ncbi:MAG: DUF2802 domain-containing protein [Bdellovibrionaceae bacterium]|nr:DUF2802 domain-containing protein [Pseudobdellovibrionaceae bacterium]
MLQVLGFIVLSTGLIAVWIRLDRPTKNDPRLSRGLQLLQSKIAVLEDLSDRTETQAQQLTALLENKCKQIQEKLIQADQQLSRIDQSLKKSLEITEIFQDRIPHQEIIERQNTLKYVKAAKMAHEGRSVADIQKTVDLHLSEIEFITKVNRDQLMFAEDSLPSWAQSDSTTQQPPPSSITSPMTAPTTHITAPLERNPRTPIQAAPLPSAVTPVAAPADKINTQAVPSPTPNAQTTIVQNGRTLTVKPFEFKKINLNGNLS